MKKLIVLFLALMVSGGALVFYTQAEIQVDGIVSDPLGGSSGVGDVTEAELAAAIGCPATSTQTLDAGDSISCVNGDAKCVTAPVQGNAAPVDLTSGPQIATSGHAQGDVCYVRGLSNTNTVKLDDGTGLVMESPTSKTLGLNDIAQYIYNGTAWVLTTSGIGDVSFTDLSYTDVTASPYNAVGDGVNDDTAEILAAIAAAASGTTIFFPAGTYKVSACLDIGTGVVGKKLILEGVGLASLITGNVAGNGIICMYLSPGAGDYGPSGVRNLWVRNTSTTGFGIIFGDYLGGFIRDVTVWAHKGIVMAGFSGLIEDTVVFGDTLGLLAGGFGIAGTSHTTMINIDVVAFETGLRASGNNNSIIGSRFEVNKTAMKLGVDQFGVANSLGATIISGNTFESNDIAVDIVNVNSSTIGNLLVLGKTNAPSGNSTHCIKLSLFRQSTLSNIYCGGSGGFATAGVSIAAAGTYSEAIIENVQVENIAAGDPWLVTGGAFPTALKVNNTNCPIATCTTEGLVQPSRFATTVQTASISANSTQTITAPRLAVTNTGASTVEVTLSETGLLTNQKLEVCNVGAEVFVLLDIDAQQDLIGDANKTIALETCIPLTYSGTRWLEEITTNLAGTTQAKFCIDTGVLDYCLNPETGKWRMEDGTGALVAVEASEFIATTPGTAGQVFTLGGGDASTEPAGLCLNQGFDGGLEKWVCLHPTADGRTRAVRDLDGTLSAFTDATGELIPVHFIHATDCTAVTTGLAGDSCWEQDANTLYQCEPTAAGCDTAGEWIAASSGSATVATSEMMKFSGVDYSGNASAVQPNGTGFDANYVRYTDAVTSCSSWYFDVPVNLATVPAWNLVLVSKGVSGSGGDVSLTLACRGIADNVAFDSTMTYVFGASGNPAEKTINTSANYTRTTISGTNLDSTLAIAASTTLECEVCRVGGDGNDSLNVGWDLRLVKIRFTENN